MVDPAAARLRALLEEATADLPPDIDLEFRHMFGGMGVYTRGRIFATLSDAGLALKLAPPDRDDLLTVEGAEYLRYAPDSPPSKQYIRLPETLLTPGALHPWVEKSIAYAQTLPLPERRPKR